MTGCPIPPHHEIEHLLSAPALHALMCIIVVMAQSAIIVRVTESDELVHELRNQFDSSTKLGVPAHITVLYPFMPPELITEAVLDDLRCAIQSSYPFTYQLATTGRFPGVLYLVPEPSAPLIDLTVAVSKKFPAYPPYEGQFQTIVPHLTISDGGDLQAMVAESQLHTKMDEQGRVVARCKAFTIFENSSGVWREMYVIPLTGGSAASQVN